jgi:hypothetical protein
MGNRVETIFEDRSGNLLVRWDGRDFQANLVQAGVYLVVVEALGQKETNTLAVVK